MQIEQVVEIEKLSNLGYGIAKQDGFVIFVASACPKDKLKIRLTKKNKNFANAEIVEIIEPSPYRVKPFCPMQKVCGACQLQFIDYEYQLKLKKQIVEDTVYSIYGNSLKINDVIPSPKTTEYRHKIQYPISETKNSKRILAGYYKTGTHEIVNIKYCPIQPHYCDEIIDFVRNKAQELGVKGYNEKKHSGDLKHVVIRASSLSEESLVTLVINSTKPLEKVKELAKSIYTNFEKVRGVTINLNPKKTNLILGEKTETIEGEGYLKEALCDKIYKIGPETFFQVNPYTADGIFRFVKDYISQNFKEPLILDAYAGITAFGIALSDTAKKIVSVEEVKASVCLAEKIVKENNIRNIELHNMDAGKFFEKESKTKGRKFNITILDPPRKGCSVESLEYALKLTTDKIIYVSCNPATLARDLKYLANKGCKVDLIQPFDMFPHTYHIENVAIISV